MPTLHAAGNSFMLAGERGGLSSAQCRWLLLMVFVGHFEVAVLYLVSFAHICVPLP